MTLYLVTDNTDAESPSLTRLVPASVAQREFATFADALGGEHASLDVSRTTERLRARCRASAPLSRIGLLDPPGAIATLPHRLLCVGSVDAIDFGPLGAGVANLGREQAARDIVAPADLRAGIGRGTAFGRRCLSAVNGLRRGAWRRDHGRNGGQDDLRPHVSSPMECQHTCPISGAAQPPGFDVSPSGETKRRIERACLITAATMIGMIVLRAGGWVS